MVAVVNEAFVNDYFSGGDAIGQRIVVFGTPREVVGIMRNIRYSGPSTPAPATMYFPLRQQPWPDCTLLVRASGDSAHLAPALRGAVRAADPSVAPFDVMTLDAAIAEFDCARAFRAVPAHWIWRAGPGAGYHRHLWCGVLCRPEKAARDCGSNRNGRPPG